MSKSMRASLIRHLFTSIDAPVQNPIRRFVLSARLGLWPAICFTSLAFAYLIDYRFSGALLISLNLSLIASLGFLFNDALDKKIDAANNNSRWTLQTRLDLQLFLAVLLAYLVIAAISFYFLSKTVFILLLLAAGTTAAYSVIFKRILLLGNLIAAALSMTPGWIMLVDASMRGTTTADPLITGAALVIIGFLLLVSREIRFDEFDKTGDRIGNRVTAPMFFQRPVLDTVHIILIAAALTLFVFTITTRGAHPTLVNLLIGLSAGGIAGGLTFTAYRSPSKTVFYKLTRIILFILPASIFLSF